MRHRIIATCYYAALSVVAIGGALIADAYLHKADAGWRGCGVTATGSYNAGIVEDLFGANGPGIAAGLACDTQIDRFVLGAAVDYGWKRFSWAGADIDVKGWSATGRAGILVNPATLAYVLGGWTDLDADAGFGSSIGASGAVAGGGIEVDLTNGFFAALEYRRLMLTTDEDFGDAEANVDSVGVRLTYKFTVGDNPFDAKPMK